MNSLRVKGGVREQGTIDSFKGGKTHLRGYDQVTSKISEGLIKSFIHFMENTIRVWRLLSKAFPANIDYNFWEILEGHAWASIEGEIMKRIGMV